MTPSRSETCEACKPENLGCGQTYEVRLLEAHHSLISELREKLKGREDDQYWRQHWMDTAKRVEKENDALRSSLSERDAEVERLIQSILYTTELYTEPLRYEAGIQADGKAGRKTKLKPNLSLGFETRYQAMYDLARALQSSRSSDVIRNPPSEIADGQSKKEPRVENVKATEAGTPTSSEDSRSAREESARRSVKPTAHTGAEGETVTTSIRADPPHPADSEGE